MSGLSQGYLDRFGGLEPLYGRAGLERLARSRVIVVGLGGVGSWTVEALARSGVGSLTLIDPDEVCVTNANRQLPALEGEVGRTKAAVLAERVRKINPEAEVSVVTEYLTAASAERLLPRGVDVVVDAIDSAAHKVEILDRCRSAGLCCVTVGAAGGKRSGRGIQVVDLARSGGDPLLRQVRKKLRRERGWPRDPGSLFGIAAVFSTEPMVFPDAGCTATVGAEPTHAPRLGCEGGLGSAAFVTGAFGLAAAEAALQRLIA